MRYEETKADAYLSNFVKCFWTSETLTEGTKHTILPNGYFDLIVEIKNQKLSKIKLTGIWTMPIDVKTESNTKIFAVRFKPLATEILKSVNLKPLLNTSTNLEMQFLRLNTLSFDNFYPPL